MQREWKVEGGHFKFLKGKGFKAKQVPAWRVTDGSTCSQLTSIEGEAAVWAASLNTGHRPVACQLS